MDRNPSWGAVVVAVDEQTADGPSSTGLSRMRIGGGVRSTWWRAAR
jgi:hypothetical protein